MVARMHGVRALRIACSFWTGRVITTASSSAFIDGEKTVIQRQSQERETRAHRGTELRFNAAIRGLGRFQLPHQQVVPFFPSLHITLKERLGLVVARVLQV